MNLEELVKKKKLITFFKQSCELTNEEYEIIFEECRIVVN